jgi:DNA repair protein RecO (recombination protein O)
MKEEFTFHGVVLETASSRDFDKRLTILTRERGKITVWASGAKKPGNPLMAATRNFVFGAFSVSEGKAGYNLRSVRVTEYFEDIAGDLNNACYGAYILELAAYMGQENLEAEEMVNLIYLSLKAILKDTIPDELVRRVFELRMLFLNGEYTELPPMPASEACNYTWKYVLETSVEKLYSFMLKEDVLREFAANVDLLMHESVRHSFRSLGILKSIQ